MKKKVINIGDVFFTEMYNLVGLKLVNFKTIKDIEETFEESDKYIYKSVIPEYIEEVPEVSRDGKLCNCTMIIKYIGEGKFEEMETGAIILCEGSREMEEYKLVDDANLKFRTYKLYESYKNLNEDIQYIRENPIVLYNGEKGQIKPISEITEVEKMEYMKYSKEERIDIIEKIKKVALDKFNKSIENQVNVDHEMANLENQIESFGRNI